MNRPSILTRARALEIASLDRSSTRRKLNQFRIEGLRSVESAISARAPVIEILVRTDLLNDERLEFVRGSECEVLAVDPKTASRLSDVVQDQGIIAVAEIPTVDRNWIERASRVIALDGIQDPGNVGTIVRCAAWFGFDSVVAAPGTADYFNPKTVRSMAGSMWDVNLVKTGHIASTLRDLKDSGFGIAGADLQGRPLSSWQPAGKVVLALGNEAHGLSRDVADLTDTRIRIEGGVPSRLGVESLNVAVAAAILMYRIGG